jgi:hypothetical protein
LFSIEFSCRTQDPFSQGAYAYAGVGTLDSDWDTLAAPIRDSANRLRVAFAGSFIGPVCSAPLPFISFSDCHSPSFFAFTSAASVLALFPIPRSPDPHRHCHLHMISHAGEHTSKWYRGTVHGAYISGQRAAAEVLAAWSPPAPPASSAVKTSTAAWASTATIALGVAIGLAF